jgi:dsRNA-specific ribonuclease
MSKFHSFLYKLLSNRYISNDKEEQIVSDKYINLLLSKEYMIYWANAFTHRSVDSVNNYENAEYTGDRVLKLLFTDYVKKNISNATPEMLTNYDNEIMKSEYQLYLAKKIKLDKFIIVSNLSRYVEFDIIVGDVFEAFIGTLYEVSNKVKAGLGTIYVNRFLEFLFQDEDLTEKGTMAPRNHVNQLFGKAKIGKDEDGLYILKYPKDVMDKIQIAI